MTQTSDFENFSQMLDQDESLEGLELTADQKVLVELREVLREDTAGVALPDGFAEETASQVAERYHKLATTEKLFDRSRGALLDYLFHPRGFLNGLALAATGLGLAKVSFTLLGAYGLTLLLFSFLWLLKERRSGDDPLPGLDLLQQKRRKTASLIFYTLPALAVGSSGVLAAQLLGVLAQFSITFQDGGGGLLRWLQVMVALGTAVLLVKACIPLWQAHRARAATHLLRLALFQAFHALWLGGLVYLFSVSVHPGDTYERVQLEQSMGIAPIVILVLFVMAVATAYRHSEPVLDPPGLGKAARAFLSSAVLSLMPIGVALAAFYQAHLTREIKEPSFEYVLRDVNAWVAEESAIPPDQNGYLLLRPYLIAGEQEKPKNAGVAESFRALSQFHELGGDSWSKLEPTERAKYQQAKGRFLAQLPKIQRALSLPSYSDVAVEGFRHQSLTPNLITYRAISQGLSLLTQEALAQGRTDQALDYAILGLRWADKEEPASSLRGMVKVAQMRISISDLERPLSEGLFSREQLVRLSQALRKALPPGPEFNDFIKRETVLTDKAFRGLMGDGDVSWSDLEEIGLPPVLSILPLSYWESERKAYWNFQLANALGRASLSNPQFEQEINPLNVTTANLVVDDGMALVQFSYLHSTMSALILMCELEIYRQDQGEYPESLEFLAGRLEQDVRVDFMDPRPGLKKSHFRYSRTAGGYTLESHSPWYERLQKKSPQAYSR